MNVEQGVRQIIDHEQQTPKLLAENMLSRLLRLFVTSKGATVSNHEMQDFVKHICRNFHIEDSAVIGNLLVTLGEDPDASLSMHDFKEFFENLGKGDKVSNREMASFLEGDNQHEDSAVAGDLLEALRKDPDASVFIQDFQNMFQKLSSQKVFNDSGAQEIYTKCEEVACFLLSSYNYSLQIFVGLYGGRSALVRYIHNLFVQTMCNRPLGKASLR